MTQDTALGHLQEAVDLLQPIPHENWATHTLVFKDTCCAVGHLVRLKKCGGAYGLLQGLTDSDMLESPELRSFRFSLETLGHDLDDLTSINGSPNRRYPQATPKDRVLAFLNDCIRRLKL